MPVDEFGELVALVKSATFSDLYGFEFLGWTLGNFYFWELDTNQRFIMRRLTLTKQKEKELNYV